MGSPVVVSESSWHPPTPLQCPYSLGQVGQCRCIMNATYPEPSFDSEKEDCWKVGPGFSASASTCVQDLRDERQEMLTFFFFLENRFISHQNLRHGCAAEESSVEGGSRKGKLPKRIWGRTRSTRVWRGQNSHHTRARLAARFERADLVGCQAFTAFTFNYYSATRFKAKSLPPLPIERYSLDVSNWQRRP